MKRVLGILLIMSSFSAMAFKPKTTVLCDKMQRAVVTSATVTELANNMVAFHYFHIGNQEAPNYEFDLVGYKVQNGPITLENLGSYNEQEYVLFDEQGKKTEVKVKKLLDLPRQCPVHSRAPCDFYNNDKGGVTYYLDVSNEEISFKISCYEKFVL